MLSRRGNKWWAEGYYWDRKQNRRKRWRRSTGIVDDGTARTKRIAEQIAADIGQSYAVGAVRKARPLTLKDAIRIHVAAHERAGSSDSTIDIVVRKAARLYEFFGPDYDCNAFTDGSLIEYADHRRLMPGTRRDSFVKPGTIHRELRTLRESLADAVAANKWDGTIPKMPDLGRVYVPLENWIDKPQSQRVLMALPAQWRDHFVMYRQLGLDRAELYRLDPDDDINWARNELRVRGTKTVARDRIMPLTRETRAILEARRGKTPMFENWHNALRDLALACKKAGVPRTTFKDLRRSFATELAIRREPMIMVMHLMGHTSTRMLEQVYARVGQGAHMHEVMESVSELRPAIKSCVDSVPVAATGTNAADNDAGSCYSENPEKDAET